MMDASKPTAREGQSADGCIAFARYLQLIAVAEVERTTEELHADAFAVAHPDRPQVRRDVSVDDLRDDLEEVKHAIRFFELAKEMEAPELEGAE
jgi:hypothetical protein